LARVAADPAIEGERSVQRGDRGGHDLAAPSKPIRIDYLFAPAEWELIEERAIENDASDHRAVVARFRVK
jgi:endonuclease/exonuclease/phosphatase (EEP) superfamily protein YafD